MENKKVEKYLIGLHEEQKLQDNILKPGDPQLSALSQGKRMNFFFSSQKEHSILKIGIMQQLA